jgi:hypothetical protein
MRNVVWCVFSGWLGGFAPLNVNEQCALPKFNSSRLLRSFKKRPFKYLNNVHRYIPDQLYRYARFRYSSQRTNREPMVNFSSNTLVSFILAQSRLKLAVVIRPCLLIAPKGQQDAFKVIVIS